MTLPSLVIVGAQKCGTSSLAATLRSHPQVFMSRPKELHYFDRRHRFGLEWYEQQFAGAGERHQVVGEATPVYMYDEAARRRLHETLPDARLVAILRDPVKRAYSHYWHERRLGREPAETFEEALDLEAERIGTTRAARMKYSYTDRGHYLDQLEPLVRAQGRDRVHVMLLDDLTRDRERTLRDLMAFLDLDPDPVVSGEAKWTNRYRVKTDDGRVKPVEYPPMQPATRARLVALFRASNDRLADWLGRDLSAWNS